MQQKLLGKWCWKIVLIVCMLLQFVIVSLSGWGLLFFGAYKFFTKGGKKEEVLGLVIISAIVFCAVYIIWSGHEKHLAPLVFNQVVCAYFFILPLYVKSYPMVIIMIPGSQGS